MASNARRAASPGLAWSRRRPRGAVPRRLHVTAWYTPQEYETVLANAAAARLAPAAWVAEASLRPAADGGEDAAAHAASGVDATSVEGRRLLQELLAIHRQLRGACINLNQAVARLNTLNEPVGELPAVAAYVRRVTTAVDAAVATFRDTR